MNGAPSHVSLDLETLGIMPGAAVLSVGVCLFVPNEVDNFGRLLDNTYLFRLDLESQLARGLRIDASVLRWWAGQDSAVQSVAFGGAASIESLHTFLCGLDIKGGVWGNGPSFDQAILGALFERFNLSSPWDFWLDRDVRTALCMADIDKRVLTKPKEFSAHRADHDAAWQAQLVQVSHRKLGIL